MKPFSDQQRLFLVDAIQLYEAWHAAATQVRAHRYGMKWLKSGNSEYLVRLSDAKGNGKSLGPRSSKTEEIFKDFVEAKARAEARFKATTVRLDDQAKLNKALRLGRVPEVAAKILRELDLSAARDDFRIVGTHALYAYESMAGVHFMQELLASGDIDLLYDPRKSLTVVSSRLDGEGLLGLLRKADKSFEPIAINAFRAINDQGFMVDFIIPQRAMHENNPVRFSPDDLTATEVPNLQWLTNAPAVSEVAIATNGLPVRMRVPDPRAFLIHKTWLSSQDDRDPLKKPRDLHQAQVVFTAIKNYLPQYEIRQEDLKYLPKGVIQAWANQTTLPTGR
jgi:hypothetical protein